MERGEEREIERKEGRREKEGGDREREGAREWGWEECKCHNFSIHTRSNNTVLSLD